MFTKMKNSGAMRFAGFFGLVPRVVHPEERGGFAGDRAGGPGPKGEAGDERLIQCGIGTAGVINRPGPSAVRLEGRVERLTECAFGRLFRFSKKTRQMLKSVPSKLRLKIDTFGVKGGSTPLDAPLTPLDRVAIENAMKAGCTQVFAERLVRLQNRQLAHEQGTDRPIMRAGEVVEVTAIGGHDINAPEAVIPLLVKNSEGIEGWVKYGNTAPLSDQ